MACRTVCHSVKATVGVLSSRVLLTAIREHYAKQGRCLVSVSQHCHSTQPPKKPAGAFLKFRNDRLPAIISQNPDAGLSEQSKMASKLWHNLDSEERNRRKLHANEEMQAYHQRYLTFLHQLTDQERSQLTQDKQVKKVAFHRHRLELQKYGKPKKPPNSFNLFVRASRLQLQNAEPPNFLKGLVEDWKLMPEDEKNVYQDSAKREKVKYQLAMDKWEQQMREIGRVDLIRKKSKQQSGKVTTAVNKSRLKAVSNPDHQAS